MSVPAIPASMAADVLTWSMGIDALVDLVILAGTVRQVDVFPVI